MVPLTRILLQHGADPDARDKRGIPVHASARAPDVRAVLDEHRRARRAAKRAGPSKGAAKRTSSTKRRRGE